MVSDWLADVATILLATVGIVVFVVVPAVLVSIVLVSSLPADVAAVVCFGSPYCLPTRTVAGLATIAGEFWFLARLANSGYVSLPDAW